MSKTVDYKAILGANYVRKRSNYRKSDADLHLDNSGVFSGYASVFNVEDSDSDVILPGAFKNSIQAWQQDKIKPKMLWQHNTAEPIGIWTKIVEDERGLYVEGKLLMEVGKGKEAYHLIQNGIVTDLSIGFRIKKHRVCTKTRKRYIEEVDLIEISLVTFGANSAAKINPHNKDMKVQASLDKSLKVIKECIKPQ